MNKALWSMSLVMLGCASSPGPVTPAPTSSASASAATTAAPPPNACTTGDVAACDVLFERWSSRELLPAGKAADAKRDGEALKHGCDDHKIGSACMGYALMLKYGTATGTRDNDASKPYFSKLKQVGDLNGYRGLPVSVDGQASRKKAEEECEKGRARACAQAGWAAYDGVQRDKSLADAFRFYDRACELGFGTGCRWAGHFAVTYPEVNAGGRGVALLKKGCDSLHNPGACDELGLLDAKMKADVWVSFGTWSAACDDGSRSACFHAGHALLDKGKEEDAKKLLKLACDAGEEGACKATAR